MPALMVQGCTSWAGKSLLVTALCRWFARRGVRVAPFKAQNMSNNARVVDGGEIGAAQWLQAHAAGVPPDVRMNPVLVKPEASGSQVVLLGRVHHALSRTPYPERAPVVWPAIARALDELRAEFDLVLIEGAGSPAEINLADIDVANMRVAAHADAAVVLVADIDRGGAFAHLYGTWALLDPRDRRRIGGFVLNRFRGDLALLRDGPAQLERLTGVPTLGVVPMLDHDLPDEDGAALHRPPSGRRPTVGVVRYPTASNLDEFTAVEQVADLVWVTRPEQVPSVDLLVLPGSKHVAHDLAWLHTTGLDTAIRVAAQRGLRVLGICGGMQMLGVRIEDPVGVDGDGVGLGLLPLVTRFHRHKRVCRGRARFTRALPAAWAPLSGREVETYEIRHGHTTPCGPVEEALDGDRGWVAGPVLGIATHGVLEDPEVLRALFGGAARPLDATFELLADAVDRHLDTERLWALAGLP